MRPGYREWGSGRRHRRWIYGNRTVSGVLGAKARYGLIREEMTIRRLEIEAQTAEARIRLANQEAQLAKTRIEKNRLEALEAEARAQRNRSELLEVQAEKALMMERMESRRIDEENRAK